LFVISFYGLHFRVSDRVRVLESGFCVRVRVSVTGSGSYVNENSEIFLRFVLPSADCAELNIKFGGIATSRNNGPRNSGA